MWVGGLLREGAQAPAGQSPLAPLPQGGLVPRPFFNFQPPPTNMAAAQT